MSRWHGREASERLGDFGLADNADHRELGQDVNFALADPGQQYVVGSLSCPERQSMAWNAGSARSLATVTRMPISGDNHVVNRLTNLE
jgi:hypothetical protein